jgi:Mrp family chromosome partitioning ATPase
MLLARLPKLLLEAKEQAGRIIVDGAPVGIASESLQIAQACDQVIVAVRPGHTDRRLLIQSRDMLTRAGAPVVGVVVVAESAPQPDDVGAYGYAYGYGPPEDSFNGEVFAAKKASRPGRLLRE